MDDVQLPQPIFVLSDGTGATADKMLRAALRQFRGHLVHVRTYSEIDRPEKLRRYFRAAAQKGGLVVTTLVSEEMRIYSEKLSREMDVPHIDLLGPLLSDLEQFLSGTATQTPGLLHGVDEAYFRRIAAVEYTVKADDGKEPRMLQEADIVLTGVSRTSKTPLSTFLAHKGFKVGNVPLVLDRPPPAQLFEVDPRRVFALTIDPKSLAQIRRDRLLAMGMGDGTNYSDMDYILAELEYADELFRGHREWPIIDVTGRAVEETAAIIVRYLQDRGLLGPLGDVSQL